MDKPTFITQFIGTFVSEHGSVSVEDREFMAGFLDRAYDRESSASGHDIEALISGDETEDGDFEVPEELAERFPLLNCIALYGISYDEEELKEEFERLWREGTVH